MRWLAEGGRGFWSRSVVQEQHRDDVVKSEAARHPAVGYSV